MIISPIGKVLFHYKQKVFGDFPDGPTISKVIDNYMKCTEG